MTLIPLTEVILRNTNPVTLAHGGSVFVYERGTTTEVNVYDEELVGTPVDQPLIVDGTGRPMTGGQTPWVEPGRYDLVVSVGGAPQRRVPWEAGDAAQASEEVAEIRDEINSVMDYGAKGDGTTNDAPAFQAAMAGGGRVTVPDGTYRFNSGVTYEGEHIFLDLAPGAVLDFSHLASGSQNFNNALDFAGTEGATKLLTANAELGATVLTVASSAGFAAGDWIRLGSDARYAPSKGASLAYKIGEFARILSTTGTTITLDGAIDSGPYKTSDEARISKVSLISGVRVEGGTIVGPGTGHEATAIMLDRCQGARVKDVAFKNFDYKFVDVKDCIDTVVNGIHVDGGTSASNGFYGVAFSNCTQDALVVNSYFRSCRHAVTTDFEANVLGIPRRLQVASNRCDRQTATAIDSHNAGEDIVIVGNTINNPGDSGISTRSPKTSVIGNTVRNPGDKGIYLRNQSDRQSEYIVTGNKVVGAASYGIHFRNPPESELEETTAGEAIAGVVIADNEVADCAAEAIYCVSEASYSLKNINISGNVLRGGSVRLEKVTDSAVVNNQMSKVGAAVNAIHLLAATDITVLGNTISYETLSAVIGIRVRTTSAQVLIVGNRVKNAATGISLENTVTNTTLRLNDLRSCTAPVSLGTGTGNSSADNVDGTESGLRYRNTTEKDHTGTTSNTSLKPELLKVPTALVGQNKKVKIVVNGSVSGAGTKQLRLQYGTGTLVSGPISAEATAKGFIVTWELFFYEAGKCLVVVNFREGATGGEVIAPTVKEFTVDGTTFLQLNGTNSAEAGHLKINSVELEVS